MKRVHYLARELEEKVFELERLKKEYHELPVHKRGWQQVEILELEKEVDRLRTIVETGNKYVSKALLLERIDKALDERDQEEFMKLTNLLKAL